MSTQPTSNPPEKKTISIEMPSDPKAAPSNGEKKGETKSETKKTETKPETKKEEPKAPTKMKEPDDLPQVGATFMLKVNEILVKPGDNARLKFNAKSLNEMAETLKNIGQLQALSVYWDEGKWFLVAGERRLRAAKIAGITKLECKRVSGERGAVISTRIIENLQRENLSYYEEALEFKSALGQQVTEIDPKTKKTTQVTITQKWLATYSGKSEGYISQRLGCLELPQEIQDKMREGKVPISVARDILGEKSPEKQLEIFRKALTESGEINKKAVRTAAEKRNVKKHAKDGKRLGRPPLTDTGELPDVSRHGLEEANERLRHCKVEMRKKEEMRSTLSTIYERFTTSRSDDKKNYLKGVMAGLEYAASIRKEI